MGNTTVIAPTRLATQRLATLRISGGMKITPPALIVLSVVKRLAVAKS